MELYKNSFDYNQSSSKLIKVKPAFHQPFGVGVDIFGSVYIADSINKRIRKVFTNGTIATIAGDGTGSFSGDGGPATIATLYINTGVAIDTAGNVYIADKYNNRIRKVYL